MSELPKSVRDAMARQPVGEHPDADLLNAYQENALAGAERQRVTEHLSVCAECRQVVFLAQPEQERLQTVLAPAKARRFSWRLFAATAAVVVVVGSAILFERGNKNIAGPAPMIATETKPALPPANAGEADKIAPSSQAAPQQRDRDQLQAQRTPMIATRSLDQKSLSPAPAPPPPPAPSAPAERQSDREGAREEAHAAGAMAADAQASAQTPRGEVVGGLVASAPSNKPEANYARSDAAELKDNSIAAKAKKSEETQAPAVISGGAVAGASPRARILAKSGGTSQWRVTNAGALEHEIGSGTWSQVLTDKGSKFRAVAVVGTTVWAGGDSGVLYVSHDDGAHWEPMTLGTKDTIVSIQFDGDGHGAIHTAEGDRWATTDGGAHWSKK